eukprot:SAG22_NODE_830_length_6941_cov_2.114294_4_plen_1368_part_00
MRILPLILLGVAVAADPAATVTAAASPAPGRRDEVFAFTGKYYNAAPSDYLLWDWGKLTTVCVYGLGVPDAAAVVAKARESRVKVVVGGIDPEKAQLLNASYQRRWVAETVTLVEKQDYDGVNLDIESAKGPEAKRAITALTCALRAALPKTKSLSFDLAAYPNTTLSGYDFSGLAACLDYLIPMVYDMTALTSPGHATASSNSPLFAVAESVRQYGQLGIAPAQLVLAFPWYGYSFPCAATTVPNAGVACRLIPKGVLGEWERGYGTALDALLQHNSTGPHRWDQASSTPWLEYIDTSAPTNPPPGVRGRISQYWYDDARSLGLKYAAAKSLGVRGLAVWTADAFHREDPSTSKAAAAALWGALPANSIIIDGLKTDDDGALTSLADVRDALGNHTLYKAMASACDWLVRNQINSASLPPIFCPSSKPITNWRGAFTGDYHASDVRKQTCALRPPLGPFWHVGQAAKALALASSVPVPEGVPAGHATRPRQEWRAASQRAGNFLLRQMRPDGLVTGALENTDIYPQTATAIEGLDAFYVLAQKFNRTDLGSAGIRAAEFNATNMFDRSEGLMYNFFNLSSNSPVTDKRLCGKPCASYFRLDLPLVPGTDDAALLNAWAAAGRPSPADSPLLPTFNDMLERQLQDEHPRGNWDAYLFCDGRMDVLCHRRAYWWGVPFLRSYELTGNKSHLAAAIRVGNWYMLAQRIDGGVFRQTTPTGLTASYGLTNSAAAAACIIWMRLFRATTDPVWLEPILRSLEFLLTQQMQDVSDSRLQGAVIEETAGPLASSDAPPWVVRDIAPSFFVHSIAKLLELSDIRHKTDDDATALFLGKPIWHRPLALPPLPPNSSSGTCTFRPMADCSNQALRKLNGTAAEMTQERCCTLCKAEKGCTVAVLAKAWPTASSGLNLCLLKPACDFTAAGANRVVCCLPGSGCPPQARPASPEFVLFRSPPFQLPANVISASVQITAQASPGIKSVDTGNQPHLLGAYKLAVDGVFLAMGPGRSPYGEQGVDQINVTSVLLNSDARNTNHGRNHVLAVGSFHTSQTNTTHYPWAPGAGTPRLALGLRVVLSDGTASVLVATDETWRAFDAQPAYNPAGNAGCIWYRQWQENLNMSVMPANWWGGGAAPTAAAGWSAAVVQPPFENRLALKSTRPVLVRRTTVSLQQRGPGHYIIDCGREIQGGIRIRIGAGAAQAGQKVSVGYGEELHDDHINPPAPNSPRNATIPGCAQCTVRCCPLRTTNVFLSHWTLTSEAQTIFEHEYKEFRFAEVIGAPPLTDDDVEAWIVRYPFGDEVEDALAPSEAPAQVPTAPAGLTSFSSSNNNLDTVFRLAQYTNVAASLDTSTDSNTRRKFCLPLPAVELFVTSC